MIDSPRAFSPKPDLAGSLDQGYTLPALWYTDRGIFEIEQGRIFQGTWQFVGFSEQVQRPGEFFTSFAGLVPIVVLRDGNRLRAFVNVCRHRGSVLVGETSGSRKSLQCRYHAWTYGLDGSLVAAPGSKDEPGFDRGDFSLFSLRVETWGPFVFVNPDPAARPLAAVLGRLPALIEETGLDLGAIKPRIRKQYEIAANWKVVVDNYLECYHCKVAHPSFCDLIDVDNYVVTEYEYSSVQRAPARKGGPGAGRAARGANEGFYAYLWPNFTINIYPGPGNVSLNLFLPVGLDRTLAIFDYCFVDDVDDGEVAKFAAFIEQVQNEDTALCESVQVGLRSGAFDQGRLMLSRESALRHFQRLVYQSVTTRLGGAM
jgi:phenylpropionate dioxygenase-like ring-hydroxylating dioxygenase large terminal subunit